MSAEGYQPENIEEAFDNFRELVKDIVLTEPSQQTMLKEVDWLENFVKGQTE